jgi:hypothetical protein
VVPAATTSSGVALEGRPQVRDHVADGVDGLLSVAGTKYTTARAVAEEVVDSVVRKLTGTYPSCRTAATPLPGGHVRDAALTIAEARRDYDDSVPSDTIPISLPLRSAHATADSPGPTPSVGTARQRLPSSARNCLGRASRDGLDAADAAQAHAARRTILVTRPSRRRPDSRSKARLVTRSCAEIALCAPY